MSVTWRFDAFEVTINRSKTLLPVTDNIHQLLLGMTIFVSLKMLNRKWRIRDRLRNWDWPFWCLLSSNHTHICSDHLDFCQSVFGGGKGATQRWLIAQRWGGDLERSPGCFLFDWPHARCTSSSPFIHEHGREQSNASVLLLLVRWDDNLCIYRPPRSSEYLTRGFNGVIRRAGFH